MRSTIGNDSLMSATSSERLRSSFSTSEMNEGKKKRKVSLTTPVDLEMEIENPEALLEPVVMKKTITTGNGHSYKAKFKVKRKEEIVPVKLDLGKTEKHTSYQEKEQVQSVSSKEGCLKKMNEQGSPNTIYSRRDPLVTGKNINQESSNVNEQWPPCSSLRLETLQRKIVKDSAEKEHNENQILTQKKQAVNDKGVDSQIDAGSDIHRLQIKVQKNCRKRMTKLIQKHQEQIQKFHQFWEEKRSDLEKDHKLELSRILFKRGEDPTRTNNELKILDGLFAKKMEEHNLLKDVEFKRLETEQLSAKNEERRKEAHWLAVCRSDEPTAEEVGPDVPFGNSSNCLSSDPQNDLGVEVSQTSVLAGVEQLDQQKNFSPPQIICTPPAFRGSVLGEIGVVELNKEVPLQNPEAVELSNSTSKRVIDKGDAISLPDTLVNLGDKNDEVVDLPLVEQILEQTKASWTPHPCTLLQASEDIPCSSICDAQNTSPFELAILQPNTDVPEIQSQIISKIATTETVTPEELQGPVLEQIENTSSEQIGTVQDQSTQVVEKQKASPIEVAASLHVDSVTVDQPNIELHDQEAPDTSRGKVANLETIDISHEELSEIFQDQDASFLENQATSRVEIVNPVQSNVGAPESQNQPPSTEVESQNHNLEISSSQTAGNSVDIVSDSQVHLERTVEIPDTMLLSSESTSTSQLWGNQNLTNNHFSQVNVDLTQMVANTVQPLYQAGLLGTVANHQVNLSSSPPLSLQNRLGNISKEYEQLHKSREDMKLQMKSDCEKEIQEAFAQLKNKYKLKLQVAEAELSYKKNVLDKNLSKVFMNKILAESFSSICEDHFWLPEIQQASPSSSMQYFQH